MTREERERLVQEALKFLDEMPFPGWVVDPEIEGALLASYLVVYPGLNLIGALAAMRAYWFPRGKATAKTWRARLRNWLSAGMRYGDPMVTGRCREPENRRDGLRPIGSYGPGGETGQGHRAAPIRRGSDSPIRGDSELTPTGDVARAELAKMKRLVGAE